MTTPQPTQTPPDPQAELQERFERAVRTGDLQGVAWALADGLASIPAGYGTDAMWLAITKGDAQVVRGLLKAGADPNEPNDQKKPETAVYCAVQAGQHEILSILLEGGGNPNPSGKKPVWSSVSRGDRTCLDILIAAGARTDVADDNGMSLLHLAAMHDYVKMVERLLQVGFPIDVRDVSGDTPLHYAARTALNALSTLLRAGAPVDARSKLETTPALAAAACGEIEPFLRLVAAGADPMARDKHERNAFDVAFAQARDDVAARLLNDYPAMAPTGDALDRSLVDAVRFGCTRVVKKLVALGADVGQKPGGRSLLQCAPKEAEDLKRFLRSIKSGTLLASAMPDRDSTQPGGNAAGPVL